MDRLSLTKKQWDMQHEAAMSMPSATIARLFRERDIAPVRPEDTLTSPDVFPDMKRAVQRLEEAIERQEKIGIFGDYDCDGVTGTALLVRLIQRRDMEPYVRLPHRVRDGYGLNLSIVQEIIDAEVHVLLTVDTGITAVQEIATLREHGIDVIILDHHTVGEQVPPAYAILHPQLAPHYPLPHPSGAGVALQFVRGVEQQERWNGVYEDVAIAGIGTVADVVELRGDNRTLVHSCLHCLHRIPGRPLDELIQMTELRDVTSTDIGFKIAPRINAAGRMDDPMIALRAILEGGDALHQIHQLNDVRQDETDSAYTLALEQLGLTEHTPSDAALLACADERFGHGIVGLLAGRLTTDYGKPSFVGVIEGDTCVGSLRSPAAYNIVQGLERCSAHLLRWGGHPRAAGCTMKASEKDAFFAALEEDIRTHADTNLLYPQVAIECPLDAKDISLGFYQKLQELQPYGEGNREPRFLLSNVTIENARAVGKEGAHLQGRVHGHKMIGFRLGHLLHHTRDRLDIACRIDIDHWQGRYETQLIVEDIRLVKQVQKDTPVKAPREMQS